MFCCIRLGEMQTGIIRKYEEKQENWHVRGVPPAVKNRAGNRNIRQREPEWHNALAYDEHNQEDQKGRRIEQHQFLISVASISAIISCTWALGCGSPGMVQSSGPSKSSKPSSNST